MQHRPWEAAQGHEAQMDVRATSVAPPGWLLSAATMPHTLDGRVEKNEEERRKERHSLQSLEKHAGFCLPCKHEFGSLLGSRICISQSFGGSLLWLLCV